VEKYLILDIVYSLLQNSVLYVRTSEKISLFFNKENSIKGQDNVASEAPLRFACINISFNGFLQTIKQKRKISIPLDFLGHHPPLL
jgi:hypothetical protein